MNQHKKSVIFDFDGTIANTFDTIISVANTYAHEHNLTPLTLEQIATLQTKGTRALLSSLNIPTYKLPFVINALLKNLGNEIRNVKPFIGIPETLHELKKNNVLLGIVTSNSNDNVQAFLRNNNLTIFDFMHCGKSLFGKDAALKNLISSNHLNPNNVMYIGDEIRDIQAARKTGIKAIAVAWGYNKPELLQSANPDILCSEPKELLNAINTVFSHC